MNNLAFFLTQITLELYHSKCFTSFTRLTRHLMSTLNKTRQVEPKITGHLFGVDTVDWERLIFPDIHLFTKLTNDSIHTLTKSSRIQRVMWSIGKRTMICDDRESYKSNLLFFVHMFLVQMKTLLPYIRTVFYFQVVTFWRFL